MKNTALKTLADKLTNESLSTARSRIDFKTMVDLFQSTTTLQYMLRDLAKIDPDMTVKDLQNDFGSLVKVYVEMYIRNDRPSRQS